jgi:hypothetical protein
MKIIEILEKLSEPVPKNLLKKKPVFEKKIKTGEVDYIPWPTLLDLLDKFCGLDGWEWTVKDVQQIETQLTLTGQLTIHGEDRSLTRDGTGTEDLNPYIGDCSSNAEAKALRRAASKFGLGRDLWKKKAPATNNITQINQKPNNAESKPAPGQLTREEWLARKQK